MATREELALIRAARAGHPLSQLTLGKQYIFGGVGLPKSIGTGLYWLDRAAQQGEQEACMLIGDHVPFDVAIRAENPMRLCAWYERAFDGGILEAGLTFARLVLTAGDCAVDEPVRRRAMTALEAAACAGIADAELCLIQQLGGTRYFTREQGTALADPAIAVPLPAVSGKQALEWTTRAAGNGILQAQRVLARHAWAVGDNETFLRWSLPIARAICSSDRRPPLSEEDVLLLSRCTKTLFLRGDFISNEIELFWMMAAEGGDRDARFSLGIWFAKMDAKGNRSATMPGRSDYRKAIHWLTLAGEQGIAEAWYALSRIYLRSNTGLSQYGWTEAQRCMERAGEAGHCAAQLELGTNAWRTRRAEDSNDVRAAYWLQKAATQGNAQAYSLLKKIVTCATPAPWAHAAQSLLTRDIINDYPFLMARIELAAMFGLSCPEALLLDVNTADRRHCLLVDIRSQYGRSRRRLILVRPGEERRQLTRIARLFANIDSGPNGPEGNYQKRLYLFKKLFSRSDIDGDAIFRKEIKTL